MGGRGCQNCCVRARTAREGNDQRMIPERAKSSRSGVGGTNTGLVLREFSFQWGGSCSAKP